MVLGKSFQARFATLLLLAAGLAAVLATPAQAAPTYAETQVVTDTANDYANGALDIVGVYLNERWIYDPERRVHKGEHIVFRFELRNVGDLVCGSTVRLQVSFQVAGTTKLVFGGITSTPGTGPDACRPVAAAQSSGTAKILPDGLAVTVPSASLGVAAGLELKGFLAQSFVMAGSDPVAQDLAPYDNKNAPASPPTSDPLRTYTSIGVFPFLVVEPTGPLAQYSVGGTEVRYRFDFVSHVALKDDPIRVLFTFPKGWTVSPSQGTTGPEPQGQLTGGSEGLGREFAFTVSANDLVTPGDTVAVTMEVVSDAGGYANLTTLTTVSGPKIEDDAFNVTLLTTGPFTVGETTKVRFQASYAGAALTSERMAVEVPRAAPNQVATFDAKSLGAGQYEALVRFDRSGAQTLDVVLSELRPSPHKEFIVTVETASVFSPGIEVWGLLAVLGVGAAVVRGRSGARR